MGTGLLRCFFVNCIASFSISCARSQTTSRGHSVRFRPIRSSAVHLYRYYLYSYYKHFVQYGVLQIVFCLCCVVALIFKPFFWPSLVYARDSPLAICQLWHSVQKNIHDASHVIFYLHFILNVSCILTLCRYIVIHFNGEIIGEDCVHTVRPT